MIDQGSLNLDCIAADPYSRYLYGIGSANEGTPTKDGYTDSSAVLVRSNASPASLSDITWTVISHIKGNDVSYNYPTFTSVDCAVNGKGHFTAFFRSPYRALSQATLLPMGIRYDSSTDTWNAFKGPAPYGWDSDQYFHKSYYLRPNDTEVIHIRTGYTANVVHFGSLSYIRDVLCLDLTVEWRYEVKAFLTRNTDEYPYIYYSYDYTQPGFFLPVGEYSRMLVYHKDTFYLTALNPSNATCPAFNFYSAFDELGVKCDYQGPPMNSTKDERDFGGRVDLTPKTHLYAFGGDRNGTTFFGGVFQVEDVLKIFTTEKQEDRRYLEHNLIRKDDNSSNFVVDRNFQVVGGLNPGQEPFVVALTSAGLYQFTIFGPTAGSMEGPFKVRISDNLNSLPQRVALRLRVKLLTPYEEYLLRDEPDKPTIIGGSLGGLLLMVLASGFFFWRWRRRRRTLTRGDKGLDAEGQEQSDDDDDNENLDEEEKKKGAEENHPSTQTGKHELHFTGIILEEESSPDHNVSRTNSQQPSPTPLSLEGKILSETYQDQIGRLMLSRHPRPNVITSVSNAETKP